jgi:serine/threonine protein kinase
VRGPKVNILVNRDGHACLADFSLVSLISDQQTFLSSCIEGGTTRWMGPELLAPEMFGLKKSRPTRESDCYALGMTIYEVLSGQIPFASSKSSVVIRKITGGERPERPQGDDGRYFTDGVWEVVQRCWGPRPRDRIRANAILVGLEGNPIPLEPPSSAGGDVETDRDDQSDIIASDSGMHSRSHPRLIFNYPYDPLEPPAAHSDSGLSVTSKTGDRKVGWLGRLRRNSQKFFKGITRASPER